MNYLSQFSGVLVVLVLLSSCEKDGTQNLADRNYSLVWSDEFDGLEGETPDSASWNYDLGTGDNGWGNQELQYYTNDTRNVSLDGNGNLAITARDESFGASPFTSGRITSKGLVNAQYGRIEAKMKLPYGPGIWPAFWMLGSNIDEVSWPQAGEIDIMEFRGQQPTLLYGSVHGPGYSGGSPITQSYSSGNERLDADFHVYAIEWGEDYIDYFIDDFRYGTVTAEDVPGEWVYNQEFYMLLNVAVGGSFVGFPTSETPFPQTLLVDYVRVYEEL